jgi:hypothetical protein
LIAIVEYSLKINDVMYTGHLLMIGQWTAVYVAHSLPVLMTSTLLIEQQLACPLEAINPVIQLEHLLNIPMFNADSIVINVHTPEVPLYGSYA